MSAFFRKASRKKEGELFPLCFIAGGDPAPVLFETVLRAMDGGARLIQYRDKKQTRREIYENALRLRRMTASYGVLLIINDHADIASAVEADGVHLGQDDLPVWAARVTLRKGIVGISTHTVAEAIRAEREGADYIGVGPIFKTNSKDDAGLPLGLTPISRIKKVVRIPLYAIGGITLSHLPDLFSAGADGVAALSAFSGDVRVHVAQWIAALPPKPNESGGRPHSP